MKTNQIQSRGPGHNQSLCLLALLPMLVVVIIAAGCGQGDGGNPSGKNSASQSTPSPTVKKLTPEAARMELAKLNVSFTQNAFVASAGEGDKLAVELFLAAGIDINGKNDEGIPALLAASSKGRKDVVVLLAAKGADLDARPTALLIACEQGHQEVALHLLKQFKQSPPRGFGYNSYSGSTPLKWAAKNGWTDVVKLLVEKDNNILNIASLSDGHDKTALDYAKEGGHTEIVRLLQEVYDRAEKMKGR